MNKKIQIFAVLLLISVCVGGASAITWQYSEPQYSRVVVPSVVLDKMPEYVVDGWRVNFTGSVTLNGQPLANIHVLAYLNASVVGEGYTNLNGRYAIISQPIDYVFGTLLKWCVKAEI